MSKKPIYVTQPLLPPLEEFIPYLEKIWESKIITNNGPFHQQFEQELCEHLGVEHLSVLVNGTLALIIALQALRVTGEVITTPYSFVATAHSLVWNQLTPVFVDIDPNTCNIDPKKIEAAISPKTTAIMPVHCYGTPCDVGAIQKIADTYGLKVIYDAAHAFGVKYRDESILKSGDLSVLSFHATKVFNSFEGGAIICPDQKTKQRIDYLKNFGFADEVTVMAPGINGKMSEVNAAFGLLQLEYVDQAITKRNNVENVYRQSLTGIPGLSFLPELADVKRNSSYCPIFIGEKFPLSRDQLYEHLKEGGVFGRRYFYPLISDMPMYRGLPSAASENLEVAQGVADSVLCLPMSPFLSLDDISRVTGLIREVSA